MKPITAKTIRTLNEAGGKMAVHAELVKLSKTQWEAVHRAFLRDHRPPALQQRVWDMFCMSGHWTEGLCVIALAHRDRDVRDSILQQLKEVAS